MVWRAIINILKTNEEIANSVNTEDVQKNQMEVTGLKKTEIKILMGGHSTEKWSRENRTSKLEDRIIEIAQSDKRENRLK